MFQKSEIKVYQLKSSVTDLEQWRIHHFSSAFPKSADLLELCQDATDEQINIDYKKIRSVVVDLESRTLRIILE